MNFKYNFYEDTHVRNYVRMTLAIYIRVKQNDFKREAQCAKTAISRVHSMTQTQIYYFCNLSHPDVFIYTYIVQRISQTLLFLLHKMLL